MSVDATSGEHYGHTLSRAIEATRSRVSSQHVTLGAARPIVTTVTGRISLFLSDDFFQNFGSVMRRLAHVLPKLCLAPSLLHSTGTDAARRLKVN